MSAPAFRDLEAAIFAPLSGQPDSAWTAAPPGKWSPGEIVAHLVSAMENSLHAFVSRRDRPPMTRRPAGLVLAIARPVVLGTGWFPRGRKAPESTRPPVSPDRADLARRLRAVIEGFLALERDLLPARANDLFVKHPALGDLTLREWLRFHEVHAAHHLRQMRERLAGWTTNGER